MNVRRAVALVLGTAVAPPLSPQGFREDVRVELVRVDVIATDGAGRAIADLRASEVHVRVDGKPAGIESFERLGVAEPAPVRPLEAIPVATAREPERAMPTASSSSRDPYFLAFLMDETSSSPANRQMLCDELLGFLQRGLPADVRMLVMRFDGVLRVETGWTSDIDRVRRAVAALRRSRTVPRLGVPGQLSGNQQGAANLELDAMEATMHARTSLAGLFDALRVFPDVPGRKAFFVASDGAPFLTSSEIARDLIQSSTTSVEPGADAQRRAELEADRDSDLLLDGLSWDRARSTPLVTEIARLALLRGIEVHPVRAAPHDFGGRVTAEHGFNQRATVQGGRSFSARSDRGGDSVPLTDIQAGQGMQTLAETTGGEAILSRRAFDDGLRRELALRDSGYVLAFRDPFPGDHRFHRIEISTDRRGTTLRFRRGYRVLDTREMLLEGATNRIFLAADANPLAVRIDLQSLGAAGANARVEVAIGYPVLPAAGGIPAEAGGMQVLGFCAVRDGRLRKAIDWKGPADRTSFGPAIWLVRSEKILLPPGNYRWSFAVRDERTGITSYLAFDRALP